MSARNRKTRDEGFTLVELLLASAIFSLLILLVAGVAYTAMASTKASHEWGDQNEQLRTALSQLSEDMTYGEWDVAVERNSSCLVKRCSAIRLVSYRATNPHDAAWSWSLKLTDRATDPWPGYDFAAIEAVYTDYRLEENQLVRTTYGVTGYDQDNNPVLTAESRKVLLQGLDTTNTDTSYFRLDGRVVTVVLRTTQRGAGANDVEEISSQWSLPPTARPW